MVNILFRKFKTARRIGLLRSARIGIDRVYLGALARIYKFNPWHVEAPTSARGYRNTVAELVNQLSPTTVVEVGCGLGYVLSLIDATQRFGYDVDEGVIKAARFIHGKKISFVHGDLSAVSLPKIDVLVLINWIHELSPAELERLMAPLFSRTRYLLLDAIDADGPSGYRYKHDFAFLNQRARRLSVTRPPNEGRSFHLFEVVA